MSAVIVIVYSGASVYFWEVMKPCNIEVKVYYVANGTASVTRR
jgi:hypothetical protein